jgi:hypothetical protein
MKTLLAGVFLVACLATPVLADYYIVMDVSSQRCIVDSNRPIDTSRVLLGVYETFAEAIRALSAVCNRRG